MNRALPRIALGLFVAIAAFSSLLLRRDGPPPSDADLAAAPQPALADHDNGFVTLAAAAELLSPPDEATSTRLAEMASGGRWDDALAARELAANGRALATYARISRQAALRSPGDPLSPAKPGADAGRLAQLLGVRAIARARSEDPAGALDDALTLLRIGTKLEGDANGALLHASAALETWRTGLGAVAALFAQYEMPLEEMRALRVALRDFSPDPGAFGQSLAAEYRYQRALILAGAESGRLGPLAGAWLARADGPAARAAAWLPGSYLVKPNDTLRTLAAKVREVRARAGEPCGAREPAAPAALRFSELLRPNAIGRRSVLDDPSFENAERARCALATQLALTRAALAVHGFERERGVLPPSLDALVPDYLDGLLVDGFDLAPLRFDRAKRVVSGAGLQLSLPVPTPSP